MDRRPTDENHEWKDIRTELCDLLEARLHADDDAEANRRQHGHRYIRLRVEAAAGAGADLLRLKHQERLQKAYLGPFAARHSPEAGELCLRPVCGSRHHYHPHPPNRHAHGSNGPAAQGNGGRDSLVETSLAPPARSPSS